MTKRIEFFKERVRKRARSLRRRADSFDEAVNLAPTDFLVWWENHIDLFVQEPIDEEN